jgi:hypothetical protein
VRRLYLLWMEKQPWVMRKIGKWIRLNGPAAASVADGELLSMVNGARGVSPTDAASTMASSHL